MSIRSLALPVIVIALASLVGVSIEATPLPAARTDALVVLRGFGYGNAAARAFRALEPAINRDGFDLHVPDYLTRSGLDDSRSNLQRYFDARLTQYERVHVFSFIAGAWTVNPLINQTHAANLATVIYDRSPLQERAPRIADETLHFFAWVRFGRPVFDVARTPYVPITPEGVKVGLLVETSPTSFIRKRAQLARSYGAFQFDCEAFNQLHDDCMFVDMNHDELYTRFDAVWPDILSFARSGRFTPAANRAPPTTDPFAKGARQ